MTNTTNLKDKKSLSQKWKEISTWGKIILILIIIIFVACLSLYIYPEYCPNETESSDKKYKESFFTDVDNLY